MKPERIKDARALVPTEPPYEGLELVAKLNRPHWMEPPYRKTPLSAETRKPVYILVNIQSCLYFINLSDEVLPEVCGGLCEVKEGSKPALIPKRSEEYYTNVQPGEGVKIDEFDGFYDLDYLIQGGVTVCNKKGIFSYGTLPEKGSVPTTVLLWDNGDIGSSCTESEHTKEAEKKDESEISWSEKRFLEAVANNDVPRALTAVGWRHICDPVGIFELLEKHGLVVPEEDKERLHQEHVRDVWLEDW